ncbi:MAG: LamG-like jellyroll fold domain-containing protein [Planctomycetota bacterium]|jgi:hypothetical protein
MSEKAIFSVSVVLSLGLMFVSAAQAADPSLVGWWKFDEGSGTTAADSSGYGNHGTLEGSADWDTGNLGYGILFEGSSWVELPPAAWDPIEMHVTVAFWAYGGDAQPVNHFVFAAYSADENAARQASGHIPWSNGNVYWDTGYDGSNYDRLFTALPPEYHKGAWVHWAFTKDGDAGEQKIYINGELFHEGTGYTRPMTGVNVFVIGCRGTGGRDQNYVGIIDDFRLYDRALTPEEIQVAMEGGGEGYPFALGPEPEDGALLEATWGNLSWLAGSFAVSHDLYFGTSFDEVNDGAEGTFIGNLSTMSQVIGFPGFPAPDGLKPGTTYYWRVDEVNDADPNSPWKGDVWSFSVPPKTAYNPDPADGAEFVDPNATFTWTGGFEAKLHTVYMGTNFDDVNNAAGGTPIGSASYSPGTLESEKVYYWRVDEFDPPNTYKGDIWSFTTPGAVGNSRPANGAVDVQMIETLSWTAADNATSHELYFGTDADAVGSATTASPEYVGPRALGAESYDPGGLAWHSSYAWRVDEVYPAETIKGLVWTFTTADFIGVDDFESYNDIDPPDPNSNRIFDKWIDGFGTTTNGALVGNDMPPYAEQNIVHGGAQAMIYRYDNNLKTSEATLTLVYPRDWTQEGVAKLSLWFRSASGNAAERMFVAVGNAVVYHDDPAATQKSGWNEWVIDLTAFTGVDLTNVNTITIGFGTKGAAAAGGSGTMYFDDIRLIR